MKSFSFEYNGFFFMKKTQIDIFFQTNFFKFAKNLMNENPNFKIFAPQNIRCKMLIRFDL